MSIQLKIQFPTTFVSNNFCCDEKLEFLFQALKNTHGRDFNFYVKILHRVHGLQKYTIKQSVLTTLKISILILRKSIHRTKKILMSVHSSLRGLSNAPLSASFLAQFPELGPIKGKFLLFPFFSKTKGL